MSTAEGTARPAASTADVRRIWVYIPISGRGGPLRRGEQLVTESPYVHLPSEGRVLDMGPFTMTVKADVQQTGGAFTLLEADEPPDFGPPLHLHEDEAEAFYVLEGEYVIFIRDEEHRCSAGSFIYIPAGVEHTFRVGSRPSRKLNLYSPAGMTGYFEELATANADGTTLGDDELAAVGARYGVRVLGPVPERYL